MKSFFLFVLAMLLCTGTTKAQNGLAVAPGRWSVTGNGTSPSFPFNYASARIDVGLTTNALNSSNASQSQYTRLDSSWRCAPSGAISLVLVDQGGGAGGIIADEVWDFTYTDTNSGNPAFLKYQQAVYNEPESESWTAYTGGNGDPFDYSGTNACPGGTGSVSGNGTGSAIWYAPLVGDFGVHSGSTQISLHLNQNVSGGDFGLAYTTTGSYAQIQDPCTGSPVIIQFTTNANPNPVFAAPNTQSFAVGQIVGLYGADSSGRIFVATGSSLDTNNDSISLSWSFTGAGCNLGGTNTFTSNPNNANIAGKWVLFETATTPTAGGKCFNQLSGRCFYAFLDWNLTSDGSISAPPDPYNSGTYLGLDNSVCGTGTPYFYGSVGSVVHIGMNDGTNGSSYSFDGNVAVGSTTGWNLDGSQAPFLGTATEILGTNSGSAGCASQDNSVGFQAWQYPSLANSQVTLNVISQPGTLNLPVTINIDLIEHPPLLGDAFQFLVGGSGTLTGPSCGPLTFTIIDGEAIGNIYAMDADYSNSSGGTGTLSIGLSLVTPFLVDQQSLRNAGYIASGPSYPLQVFSVDWTASSDGSCTADPIQIGQGVAVPDKKHFGPSPTHGNKKAPKDFWDSFRKNQNARPLDDQGRADERKNQ